MAGSILLTSPCRVELSRVARLSRMTPKPSAPVEALASTCPASDRGMMGGSAPTRCVRRVLALNPSSKPPIGTDPDGPTAGMGLDEN